MRALIAFEATARLGSMTAAAEEEGTTQPTISQRIRVLEEHLGLPLFDRKGGRLTLSAQGERFHREIAPGLKEIRQACERLMRHGERPPPAVVIAAGSGFMHLWLRPRLPALKRAFPDFTFKLLPTDRADDPALQAADIAIRFGPYMAQEPGRRVASEAVFPVCSPDYASEHGLAGTLTASDLMRLSLLHQDIKDPRWLDWAQWCRQAGLSLTPEEDAFSYHNYALLLNAALAHQGVALGWSLLVEDYLASGELIALGPRVMRKDYGYWLSVKHHRSALVEPIGDWLLDAVHRAPSGASA
ncbi:LysR substrate-binding domain-containing protein [Halomonas sp. H5]|uniref:LysR substrate-binding domain-containing protein n=1 Tax=Halomonas sp. H5 TaxID=3423910 RepID=UPI003D365057